MAIQKTTTGSISRLEIQDFIAREYPSFTLTSDIQNNSIRTCQWFLNIGFRALTVWTINPEQQTAIETELEAISKGERRLRKFKQKQPQISTNFKLSPLHKSAYATAREMIKVNNANECTIHQLQEIAARYPGLQLDCNYPELLNSPDQKMNVVNMVMNASTQVFSIDHSIMAAHYKQILKWSRENKKEIKASMKNPDLFDALLRGDLKHGYELSPGDLEKLIAWHFLSTEENEKSEENPQPDNAYAHPSYSTVQLIVLAYKNSCSGQLNEEQILQFISNHFPGLFIENATNYKRNLNRFIRTTLGGKATQYFKFTWTWKAIDDQREWCRTKKVSRNYLITISGQPNLSPLLTRDQPSLI